MRRLLSLLLLAPLVALAQPAEGMFTLELRGSAFSPSRYDGPRTLTGQARFGGVDAGMGVPQGTNSVLTFQATDPSTVLTMYSKDVYRPGVASGNVGDDPLNPDSSLPSAPQHEVVSGDPADYHGLSLFDYGLRLDLADGRTLYSTGRPSESGSGRRLTLSRSTPERVEGRVTVPVSMRTGTYSSITGSIELTFHATPSETPSPGLPPEQALVVVTGEYETTAVLPATWGRGVETSGCAGCRPWILRFGQGTLYAGNSLDIVGQRPQGPPGSIRASTGWGGFRPGAAGQAPLGFVRSNMLYNVQLPGEPEVYHGVGQPGLPIDLSAEAEDFQYPLGIAPGATPQDYIHARDRGFSDATKSYAGWTDFYAWKARMNPLPRDVHAVVRVSVRYHTPEGESEAPPQGPGPGMGIGGSFTARIQGTSVSGTATSMDSGAGFQFQMTGGAGSTPGLFTFGGRGELHRRTYSLTSPASGPPGNSQAIGSLTTTNNTGQQMSCVFQSGTLQVTAIEDETVEGTFRGNTRCQTPTGATVYRSVTGGAFEAVRPMAGGQINLPACVTVPPGVTLPASSPIPACN